MISNKKNYAACITGTGLTHYADYVYMGQSYRAQQQSVAIYWLVTPKQAELQRETEINTSNEQGYKLFEKYRGENSNWEIQK
jgi:hypothetical protein